MNGQRPLFKILWQASAALVNDFKPLDADYSCTPGILRAISWLRSCKKPSLRLL